MKTWRSLGIFVLLLVMLVAFVVVTSQALPATVAAHFGAGGSASRFMPRSVYRFLMPVVIFVAPLLLVVLSSWNARRGKVNIPNRVYWLAPERYEATAAYLDFQGKVFAAILAFFLAYTHWLVVEANASAPPVLPLTAYYGGLCAMLVSILSWVVWVYAHFNRRA